ncbi:hypothetical protein ES703_100769 [subsurface metagenome]
MNNTGMKKYRVFHRAQKLFSDQVATSAQAACSQAGWYIGDCWVRENTLVVIDLTSDSGHRGGGWKNVTSHEIPRTK